MKNITIITIAFSIFLFSSCSTSSKGTSVVNTGKATGSNGLAFDFADSEQLTPLLDQAEAEGKLIFVDFYTTWCTPCKLMEEEVYTDRELARFMNQNFINYKVDAEKGNGVNLASIFGVRAYPTLLFLDAKGKVLERKEGAIFQTEFRAMANRAMAN